MHSFRKYECLWAPLSLISAHLSSDPSKESWLPDKELYIRWLQLATFLPVIRYSHLPSEYTMDKMVLELAKNLTNLRQTKVRLEVLGSILGDSSIFISRTSRNHESKLSEKMT